MLGACRLATKSCLSMCVRTVLVNLKRYPQVVKAKISHELIIYILYIGQAVDLALSAIARITAS